MDELPQPKGLEPCGGGQQAAVLMSKALTASGAWVTVKDRLRGYITKADSL